MRVVSADSGAAILDDKFQPVYLVASVSVMVEPPYREASLRLQSLFLEKLRATLKLSCMRLSCARVCLEKCLQMLCTWICH